MQSLRMAVEKGHVEQSQIVKGNEIKFGDGGGRMSWGFWFHGK